MDKGKTALIVKGYLWKEKRKTVFTALFLCFVVMFLFIGNQLFQNVRLANKMNAEALEGKQHVTYYGITEKNFKKIKNCPFVALAGQNISIGHTQDGTGFSCVDENYRELSATVADKNIKHLFQGRWAEKADEIVFTENYMERYGLRLGDQVTVDLTSTDSSTGDLLFKIPDVSFTIAGVIANPVGFQDRKMGYVSENFGLSVIEKYHGKVKVNAFVLFDEEDNLSKK